MELRRKRKYKYAALFFLSIGMIIYYTLNIGYFVYILKYLLTTSYYTAYIS